MEKESTKSFVESLNPLESSLPALAIEAPAASAAADTDALRASPPAAAIFSPERDKSSIVFAKLATSPVTVDADSCIPSFMPVIVFSTPSATE